MAHPAFADLNTDSDGNPCVWENHYHCDQSSGVPSMWSDIWSCQCDDECPDCIRSCEPEQSTWIGPMDATFINATGGKAVMRRATVTFEPNPLW